MARDHLTGEVTGSVIVGRYAFQVGAPAGMRLTLAPSSERTPVGPVEDALARRPPAVPAQTPAAKPSEFVDDASRVTDVAKQAVQLFGALAKGQELDASSLEVEIIRYSSCLTSWIGKAGSMRRSAWHKQPALYSRSHSAGPNSCIRSTSHFTQHNRRPTHPPKRGQFMSWAV